MNPSISSQTPVGLPQAQLVAEVEAVLRDTVRARGLPRNLADAVVYAGLGPGKRVRPTLVVRSYEAVAGPWGLGPMPASLAAAAVSIEMIHAFSLVHDDLPAMDDDDLRRGRPTLHKHTSEAMALLAGDSLLSMAFERLLDEAACRPDDAASHFQAVRLTRELGRATTDMIAGQVYDSLPAFDPHIPEVDRLGLIHRHKTAALLRAACRMGGICAQAQPEQLDALSRYAEAVGLMFQVVDDLLDVTGDAEELGKATQKDAAAGKLTYPGLMGMDGARAEVQRLRDTAHAALEPLGDGAAALARLADDLAIRRK
ncbi:MAG: polyprenyl synthetase family protein [Planctomycetota bacterium]